MGDPKKQKGKTAVAGSNGNDETDTQTLIREVLAKLDNLNKTVEKNSKDTQENFKTSKFENDKVQDNVDAFIVDFERMKEEIKDLKKSNLKLRDTVSSLSKKNGAIRFDP